MPSALPADPGETNCAGPDPLDTLDDDVLAFA